MSDKDNCFASLIDYNPENGVFTWKIKKANWFVEKQVAGTINNRGYHIITINGKRYCAHRLAWYFQYKKWPEYYIDHINGIKTDNRIANLRDVPSRINQINSYKHRNGKLAGTFFTHRKLTHPWYAKIRINKEYKFLGYYATEKEANEAYVEELQKLEPSYCL